MKAKVTCTITIEYYISGADELEADLKLYREDSDAFFEMASIARHEVYDFVGELDTTPE